jgi:hypothetical protein
VEDQGIVRKYRKLGKICLSCRELLQFVISIVLSISSLANIVLIISIFSDKVGLFGVPALPLGINTIVNLYF